MNDIDNAVKKLCADELVNYQTHIGGGYYVSVTSGYKCVDFRKFYMPYDQSEMKPTNKGIALHIDEWIDIKQLSDNLTSRPNFNSALLPSCHESMNTIVVVIVDVSTV